MLERLRDDRGPQTYLVELSCTTALLERGRGCPAGDLELPHSLGCIHACYKCTPSRFVISVEGGSSNHVELYRGNEDNDSLRLEEDNDTPGLYVACLTVVFIGHREIDI